MGRINMQQTTYYSSPSLLSIVSFFCLYSFVQWSGSPRSRQEGVQVSPLPLVDTSIRSVRKLQQKVDVDFSRDGQPATSSTTSRRHLNYLVRRDQQSTSQNDDTAPRRQMRTVLLVQVSTDDVPVSVDTTTFFNTVFDPYNYSVASHLNDCSGGRGPLFVPFDNENPVISIHVNGTSSSYTRSTMLEAAVSVVQERLNLADSKSTLPESVDHAVFCVPDNLSGPSFYASGALNSYWTMVKSSWCDNAMALQHEMLHNLGLGHAGYQGSYEREEYGDESSLMGQTYRLKSPVPHRYRCLNGQNYWKLGWFADRAVEVDTMMNISSTTSAPTLLQQQVQSFQTTEIEVVAITEPEKCSQNQALVVKVLDLFLVYNRQNDYNIDTGSFPDLLTVVQETEDGINSMLLAGIGDPSSAKSSLFHYNSSRISSADGTQTTSTTAAVLTIEICEHREGNVTHPSLYRIAIGLEESPCYAVEVAETGPPIFIANPTAAPITATITTTALPTVALSVEEIIATHSTVSSPSPSVNTAHTAKGGTTVPTVRNDVTVFPWTNMPVSASSSISVTNTNTGSHTASYQRHEDSMHLLFILGAPILLIIGFGIASCVMWRSNISTCCLCSVTDDSQSVDSAKPSANKRNANP